MPHLIIGHTCEKSARIWVRGDDKSTACEVSLYPAGSLQPQRILLDANNDYTGTVSLEKLEPGIDYIVHAAFSPSSVLVRGRLCTMRNSAGGDPNSFSFVLSSCNLSIVSVNDFLSFLSASAGISLARSSLRLPFHRWRGGSRFKWLKAVLRKALDFAIQAIAWVVNKVTGIKQPGPAYLRSPFLKLSAVFDSELLQISIPQDAHRRDATDAESEPPFLAVGDRVQSSCGATGVVASLGDVVVEPVEQEPERSGQPADDTAKKPRLRQLVVTQVDGSFERGCFLFRKVTLNSRVRLDRLGTITQAAAGRPWFKPPSFFIHAGDQIYFDFPTPSRKPNRSEYRLAYREAWFEDDALRHVLAHWPHYMTLDDHEIADQFARDFKPPNDEFTANQYLQEASVAYRDYARALGPLREKGQPMPKCGPFWYTFDKRRARFFVLDTRTRRHMECGEIIDREQMTALLTWMVKHNDDLKFVVSSVPFVAEVNERTSDAKSDWFKDKASPTESSAAQGKRPSEDPRSAARNSEQDKWSARPFRRQRDEIIEHIAANQIEHLVFLTGDMHCCYHATMRIGNDLKKYESITVHELSGGPVNQLQLARADEFDRRCIKRTAGSAKHEAVDYEVTLERFHGEVSAVLHVKVEHKRRLQVFDKAVDVVPEVEWSVIRTLTDPGPTGWLEGKPGQRSLDLPVSEPPIGESVMAGRISFVKKRTPNDLQKWPTSYTTTTPS